MQEEGLAEPYLMDAEAGQLGVARPFADPDGTGELSIVLAGLVGLLVTRQAYALTGMIVG